jgi:hypothetical protein
MDNWKLPELSKELVAITGHWLTATPTFVEAST